MTLQPTDLFAVQRGAITYKTPFSDIQAYVKDQLKATWLPSHMDSPSVVSSSTWNGPADTLTATGSVEISINGGAFGSGGPVGSPGQVQSRWNAAAIAAAAHGAKLTGRVQNTAGNVAVDYTATVDKLPDAITINPKTNVAASAAVDSDDSSAVAGLNAPARLWLRTSDGTGPLVSIAGGTWLVVPTTPATGLAIAQGQTFKLRHTSRAGASTVTTTSVYVGWDVANSVQASFVTTNAATKAPVINTVTLSDSPQPGRFTSGTFATAVTMTDDGVPASAKGVKAYVEGTFTVTTTPNSDTITAVAGTAAAPILTFATNKDLAKFAAGDAITQENSVGAPTYSDYFRGYSGKLNPFPANDAYFPFRSAFNGSTTDGGGCSTAATYNTTSHLIFEPPSPIPGTTLRVYISQYSAGVTPVQTVYVNGASTGTAVTAIGWTSAITIPGGRLSKVDYESISTWTAGSHPSMAISAIEVDGTILVDGTGPSPRGTVGSINTTAKTMTLATSTGTWGPANAGHHVIGPTKTTPASSVKLFCKLNSTLNVTDLQSADPGFTTAAGASPYTVTFPATLPTGNAPDVDIPAGATITTEVQASNTAGTVSKTSNTVTPA